MFSKIRTTFKNCRGFAINRGVKQGNPLSPLMFNLIMEPLLAKLSEEQVGLRINEERLSVLAFTDDLLVNDKTAGLKRLLDLTVAYLDDKGLE